LPVLVLTLLVYGRSLSFGFQDLDDRANVADNPRYHPVTVENLLAFWRAPYIGLYIPVTYSLWGLEATLAQRTPTPELPERLQPSLFHAGNLTLQLLCVALVYGLLLGLVADPVAAGLGAAWFSVHPLHAESVAWITETKGLLSAALSLVAVLCYLRFATTERARIAWAVAGTIPFALALLAKPTAVTIPLGALLLARLLPQANWRRELPLVALWLVLAVGVMAITKSQQADEIVDVVPTPVERLLVAADAVSFYAAKTLLPGPLCADYGRTPARVLAGSAAWWKFGILAGATALLLFYRHRTVAWVSAGWFLLSFAPVAGLVPFSFQNYSTVADRYAYLALLGPALAMAWIVARLHVAWLRVAVAAYIGVLALMCGGQVGYWRNTRTLFEHVLEVQPGSFLAHEKLAVLARREKDFATASAHLRQAVELRPRSAELNNKLGDALFNLGRTDEAEIAFRRALELQPALKEAHFNLGNVYVRQQQYRAAAAEFRRALDIDPGYAAAQKNLAILLQMKPEAAAP